MSGLEQWMGRLVAIALVGWLVEMIVPLSTMRGYVRLVVGLALMVAVVSPLVSLVGRGATMSFPALTTGGSADASLAGRRLLRRDRQWVWTAVLASVELSARDAALSVPGVEDARVSARIDEQVATPDYGVPTRVVVRIRGAGDDLPARVQAAVAEDLGVDRGEVTVAGERGGGS